MWNKQYHRVPEAEKCKRVDSIPRCIMILEKIFAFIRDQTTTRTYKDKYEVEVGTTSHNCIQKGQDTVCRKHYATSPTMW